MIILSMEKSKSLQKLFTNTGGRNGLGKVCCLKTDFSCRPFLFYEKEMVHTPKKKAAQTFAEHFCLRRRKILLSTRRSAFGADMFPSGAPAPCIPGGRPEGGQMRPESTARYRRRRAGERPTFSHRSPAPGGDDFCPRLLDGPFSLAARNRFFLGQSKKKWVRETCRF